jgi:ribosomal-protein-alanine N-acetyltransferase
VTPVAPHAPEDGFDPAAVAPPLEVPVLSDGPVVLRPFRMSDLDLVLEAADDPDIVAVSSLPQEHSEVAGRDFIERQHRRAELGDGYSFVLCPATEPQQGVGSIGLWLSEIDSGRASIGYWLLPAARGHGLAAWALRAVVSFAFGELAIPRLHLFVEPWNTASVRTAEKAGFRREALLRGWERIDGEQRDVESFALLRREWDRAGAGRDGHGRLG